VRQGAGERFGIGIDRKERFGRGVGDRLPLAQPQQVDAAMDDGVFQPCPEIALAAKIRELPPQANEGVLAHFLDVGAIPGHARRHAPDGVDVALHQIGERFLVAGRGTVHESVIVALHPRH
jgi:hypothetical protein